MTGAVVLLNISVAKEEATAIRMMNVCMDLSVVSTIVKNIIQKQKKVLTAA